MKIHSPGTAAAPRLRDRLRETTAGLILAAAEQVVTEHGDEGARVDEIARRAGVAVGTVYNYFADRDALLDALHDALKSELLAAIDGALAAAHGRPFREQLGAVLRAMLAFAEQHRQFITHVTAVDATAGRAPALRSSALAELFVRVDGLTRLGVREGALRAAHAEFYPATLLAMARAAMMVQLHRKQPTPLTDLAAPLVQLFLHGAAEGASPTAPSKKDA